MSWWIVVFKEKGADLAVKTVKAPSKARAERKALKGLDAVVRVVSGPYDEKPDGRLWLREE